MNREGVFIIVTFSMLVFFYIVKELSTEISPEPFKMFLKDLKTGTTDNTGDY